MHKNNKIRCYHSHDHEKHYQHSQHDERKLYPQNIRRIDMGIRKKITKIFRGTILREKFSDFRINPVITRTRVCFWLNPFGPVGYDSGSGFI